MADVASSSSWASYPAQMMQVQQGLQAQRMQNWRGQSESSSPTPNVGSGNCSASGSGHTTPQRRVRKRNRGEISETNRKIHGDRVLAAAGAHMMWNLLEEPQPRGPAGPEEGLSAEVIDASRRGREAAKLAIEVPTTLVRKSIGVRKRVENCRKVEPSMNCIKNTTRP